MAQAIRTNPATFAVAKMIAAIQEDSRLNAMAAELVVDDHGNGISSCSRDGGYGRVVAYIHRGEGCGGTCRVVDARGELVREYLDYGQAVRAVLDGRFGY